MRRQDTFNTLIFNLFGAPYVVERSDAAVADERKLTDERCCDPRRLGEESSCCMDRAA